MAEKEMNEGDELESLLKQLSEFEDGSIDIDSIMKASLDETEDVSDEELEALLNGSANEDEELKSLAKNLAKKDIASGRETEDGEEGEEDEQSGTEEEDAQPEAEALGEPVAAETGIPDELPFDTEAVDGIPAAETEDLTMDAPPSEISEEQAPDKLPEMDDISDLLSSVDIPGLPDFSDESAIPGLDEALGSEDIPGLPDFSDESAIPGLDEALGSEDIPELSDFSDESAIPGLDEALGSEDIPELSDFSDESAIPGLDESTSDVMDALSASGENLTDEEQLADLIAEVSAEAVSPTPTAKGESEDEPEFEPEFEEDEGLDYLKDFGGDQELDGLAGIDDDEDDDNFDMPDFSFNESFTMAGDGEGGKSGSIVRKEEHLRAERQAREEALAKKKKRSLFDKDGLLYKVTAPIIKVLSPVLAPARKVAGAAGGAAKKAAKNEKTRMVAVIVILFIVLIVSSIMLLGQYRTMMRIISENKVIVGEQPSHRLNYANYIYTTNTRTLNGKNLSLVKLMLDRYMCTFYLDAYLRHDRYFAELRDDLGNFYCLYPRLSTATYTDDGLGETVYWFDGVKDGAQELTLTIWDSLTKSSVDYNVDMQGYKAMPAKYIENSKGVRTQDYDFEAYVEGGAFSSAMSTIVYKFIGKNGITISNGITSSSEGFVSLENSSRSVAPLMAIPKQYEINESVTIGRMDFGPVRSLEDKARLTFGNLYKYYDLDRSFSAEPLFDYADGQNEMEISFDNYILVLEGMKKYGNKYVLVFHFEDLSGKRIYGEIDVSMIIRTYSGMEVSLKSFVTAKQEGGDVVFEYEQPNNVIDNTGPENVLLKVNYAMVSIPDVVTDIQIASAADSLEGASYAGVKKFVEDAFVARLSAKSGENVSLNGFFEQSALSERSLSGLYEPLAVTEPPELAVMAHTLAKVSENEYFAVVEEYWLGISGEERTHHNKTHNVIIKQIGSNYVITSDTIEETGYEEQ